MLPVLFLAAGCGSQEEELVLNTQDQTEEYREEAALEEETEPLETKGLLVHVCGAVKEPGVYEVSAGDRILDAVGAAGGFLEEAAENVLNLAQPVEDGMKIQIPTESEAELLSQTLLSAEALGKVNLNTAGVGELTSLSGIGESRAQDILDYRNANGPFQSIEEIKQVPGIKDAVFEKIKDDITV